MNAIFLRLPLASLLLVLASCTKYYKNEIPVNVTVRAGGWYQPKGHVEGDNFVVWIEDKESGRDVSGMVRQRMSPVVLGSPAPLLPPPVMLQ